VTRKLDLNALLLFFEVVNARSISSASKKLDILKSTVSRKLMFLEDQLGAILFKKGAASSPSPTSVSALYEHCERIAAEIEEGLGTTRMQTELRGMLRVSMPVLWHRLAIARSPRCGQLSRSICGSTRTAAGSMYRSNRTTSRFNWALFPKRMAASATCEYFARRLCEPHRS
jgi:hypothetical protein